MNELNEALNLCLCKMKASSDFSDSETTIAVKKLLSVIIGNPKLLVNFPNEEKLSLVLSSIICPIKHTIPANRNEYKYIILNYLQTYCMTYARYTKFLITHSWTHKCSCCN